MRRLIFPILGIFAAGIIGCESSTPNSPAAQAVRYDEAKLAVKQMEAQDPTLGLLVDNSYGYVIFPSIGEGAVGIGAASGTGYVYRQGERIGTLHMSAASIGLQLGGQTFGELIIFQDEKAFNRVINDSIEFGADVGATAVRSGAAGSANFAHGVQVYVLPKGGLMAGIALNGQKFHFTSDQVSTDQAAPAGYRSNSTDNSTSNGAATPTTQPSDSNKNNGAPVQTPSQNNNP